MAERWYEIENVAELITPALVVYPDRVDENLRRMIARTGGVARLRPHVKTHKMPDVVRRKLALGITKFKCATIAEAEMLARCGAPDVLLAYQPVGPNAARMALLAEQFSATRFSTVADDRGAVSALSSAVAATGANVEVLLDIDVGMHRSGIAPGGAAVQLYRQIAASPGLQPGGLHVYDGHIRATDLTARTGEATTAYRAVDALVAELLAAGLPVPRIVSGGTPTFPVHAACRFRMQPRDVRVLGSCLRHTLSGFGFLPAALLITRVISRPTADRLCLDLGYKAVSPDNPDPRVHLLDVPDAKTVVHSEEHLAIETARAAEFQVGDVLYGVPWHVCPTVALHAAAVTIENKRATGAWPVVARDRKLSI